MQHFNLNTSQLGKKSSTPEKYDKNVLFRIPRSENRIKYDIQDSSLPFMGYDVWNCYEVSFLTKNGLPVCSVLKIIYPADSQYIVESKSLKLYLNGFNMEKFEINIDESERKVQEIISSDLQDLLETDVKVILFKENGKSLIPFQSLEDLLSLVSLEKLQQQTFTHFSESPELLKSKKTDKLQTYQFKTDILRSNCRVTEQPDWGDLFVRMETYHQIDLYSVIAYLISFRKENHFHEEVVEMIYKRFYDIFEPEKLMVSAMYTRRGGIDINPIRTNYTEWIDEAFISTGYLLAKTWRQ